jgi:hypothetical protein
VEEEVNRKERKKKKNENLKRINIFPEISLLETSLGN